MFFHYCVLSGGDVEDEEVKDATRESTSKAGAKRRKDAKCEPKSKVAKAKGEDVSEDRALSVTDANDSSKASALENKREVQSKEFWALKDDLKNNVTTVELRVMLETNGQDVAGSELDLRDRW